MESVAIDPSIAQCNGRQPIVASNLLPNIWIFFQYEIVNESNRVNGTNVEY